MTCLYAYDDGAYVLGALSPGERAAFEGHMSTCPACREAVASLAVLPGLLGRLDAERALPPVSAPLSVLPRTLAAISVRRRAERRRQRLFAVAIAVAATVLATGVTVGVTVGAQLTGRTNDSIVASFIMPGMAEMVPVVDHLPVTARIAAMPTYGGTRIYMNCHYDVGYSGTWTLRLVLFARLGGASEQLGTWTAESGQQIKLQALTHLRPTEIARVELQRMDGAPLMVWSA